MQRSCADESLVSDEGMPLTFFYGVNSVRYSELATECLLLLHNLSDTAVKQMLVVDENDSLTAVKISSNLSHGARP